MLEDIHRYYSHIEHHEKHKYFDHHHPNHSTTKTKALFPLN